MFEKYAEVVQRIRQGLYAIHYGNAQEVEGEVNGKERT